MKKILLAILLFVTSIFWVFSFSSCTNNTVKYMYTNSEGEISYFEIDFDKNEYTYSGNACYQQGWGYMLIPNTSYEVSGDISLDYKMNGYDVYDFYNHPWNGIYPMGISSDGNILRIQWKTFVSYDFVKEGYTNNSNEGSKDSGSNSQNQSGNEGTGNGDNTDNSNTGNKTPEPVFYDGTFWYYAGRMPETVSVMENSVLKLPEAEQNGYTFDGWRIGEQEIKNVGDTVIITGNTDIYAQWTVHTFEITYYLNGGALENLKMTFNVHDLPYALPMPTPQDGQNFVNWTTDSEGKTEIAQITELKNYEIYAHYEDSAKCLTYKYSEELQGYEVSGYTGNGKSVKIPSTYKGVAVKGIGSQAFSGCSNLTSVTIPDSVTSIGSLAFSSCSNLTSVTIPDSVTSIGFASFQSCYSLTSVTIPNGVTSIAYSTFRECYSLTTVTIPNGVTSIGSGAFEGCRSLTNIEIPDSVVNIDAWAFAYCSSLTNVKIPKNVTVIHQGPFQDCLALKTVIIDSSYAANVSFIGDIIAYATDVYVRADITVTANIYSAIYNNLGKEIIDGVEYYHYQIKGE